LRWDIRVFFWNEEFLKKELDLIEIHLPLLTISNKRIHLFSLAVGYKIKQFFLVLRRFTLRQYAFPFIVQGAFVPSILLPD